MTRTTADIDLDVLARVGIALSDDARRRMLARLVADGPAYPSDLADELGLSRTNVSNHLSCLRGCGLVRTHPEGRRLRYEIADMRLADALATLSALDLHVDRSHAHLS